MLRSSVSIGLLLAACLLIPKPGLAQPVYFNTSSATQNLNTLRSVATNGGASATLLTATGPGLNNISRCTAMAVDGLSGRLFFLDGASNALWRVNLDGSSLTLIRSGLTNFPTDLALDVLNQRIYLTTSSTIQGNNTVQRLDYTGNNYTTLFTATGVSPGNGVSRCTALALDPVNSRLFIADAGTRKIWSMGLAGTGLTALATATNGTPTGLALDIANQQAYFTVSSTAQTSNLIQRVNYNGTGLTTRFTAGGSVQRCTALDLDVPHGTIFLSDAGANTLWRVPIGGGSATAVLSGLTATAKKVRWFSGPTTRPAPAITGIKVSGTNVVLNATNGFVGGTYYILTSTNVASPLSQWLPVFTNVLGASGSFALTATNTFANGSPRRFYLLRVQ